MSVGGTYRPAVGVIGAGRKGIALAEHAARQGHDVYLFTNERRRAASLKRYRKLKTLVPEIAELSPRVTVTTDLGELAASCTLVVLTASRDSFEPTLDAIGEALDGSHQVVHAVHRLFGPELHRVSEILRSRTAIKQVGAVAGPLHVSELLAGLPNAVVVGSSFPALIDAVRVALETDAVRVHPNSDNRGVEFAAALGQVVTFAVGMADGLGLGAAMHATVLTRGLLEITTIGKALGARRRTAYGLAGVGRVVDALRRGEPNYQLGYEVAGLDEVARLRELASPDAMCVDVIDQVARYVEYHRVHLPLCAALKRVLEGQEDPAEALLGAVRDDPDVD